MYNTVETSMRSDLNQTVSKPFRRRSDQPEDLSSLAQLEELEDREVGKNSNTQEDIDDFHEHSIFRESLDTPGREEVRKKPSSNSRFLLVANFWDVLCFGVCLTSANLTYGAWHAALQLGFWPFFYVTLIFSTVFISIHLCIAEMVSILPFSGGMYGFARVTLGPYFGFIAGSFESTANIIYAMYGMAQLGAYFTYMMRGDKKYEPIYWLGFYVIIIMNEFLGRKYYFRLMRVVAVLIMLIFLFYIGESIPHEHPKEYLTDDGTNDPFRYGAELTVVSLQYVAFLYFGIEIIPLVSDEVKEPRKTTPRVIICILVFISVFSLLFMFLAYCQYPSYPMNLLVSVAPLNSGFTNTFNINDRVASAFAYFALLAAVSIYVFGFAKQLKALGTSKLLPACFGWTFPETNIPYIALLVGSLIGYSILLLSYFRDDLYANMLIPTRLYLTGYMFTYCSFILVLISFIIFRIKYWTLPRGFINPLGIFSAIYGILGLLLLLYILFRYVSIDFTFAKIFACYFGILTVFYCIYSKSRQVFSEEEQEILFKVYLMKSKF